MRSVTSFILLAVGARAHAKEQTVNRMAETQELTGKVAGMLADKLVNKLVGRALEGWPFFHADLEDSTLAKAPPVSITTPPPGQAPPSPSSSPPSPAPSPLPSPLPSSPGHPFSPLSTTLSPTSMITSTNAAAAPDNGTSDLTSVFAVIILLVGGGAIFAVIRHRRALNDPHHGEQSFLEKEAGVGSEPEPSTPLPEPSTVGAYLMYSRNDGNMFIKWSRDPVEGALAFFEPASEKVSPSSFKYNNGGQKVVLKSKVAITGEGRKDYWKTWVQFIRECWKNKGVLTVLEGYQVPDLKVKINMLAEENHKVIDVESNQRMLLEGIHAVVVAGSDSTTFRGMSSLNPNLFIEKGHVYGAAAAMEQSVMSPQRKST